MITPIVKRDPRYQGIYVSERPVTFISHTGRFLCYVTSYVTSLSCVTFLGFDAALVLRISFVEILIFGWTPLSNLVVVHHDSYLEIHIQLQLVLVINVHLRGTAVRFR